MESRSLQDKYVQPKRSKQIFICRRETADLEKISLNLDNWIARIHNLFRQKENFRQKSLVVKVAPDRSIHPALHFQHFVVISKTEGLSLDKFMGYELSFYPYHFLKPIIY